MTTLALIIKWLGHACFLITTMSGTNIVIDPFGAGMGYESPAVHAHAVFVSHEHFDHNAAGVLKGNPKVIGPLAAGKSVEEGSIKVGTETIQYKSILTHHDESKGEKRGTNTVRVITVDGVRICHLGDLGHTLTASQVKTVGPVDVLMIPVGGVYTIDGAGARKVVSQLKPKYVIPMHYKTSALQRINLAPADAFLKGFKKVKRLDELAVSKDSLPEETTVVVLKY